MTDVHELPRAVALANRERWLRALELSVIDDADFVLNEAAGVHRNYRQTTGRLRDDHGFCCLGVAEDVRGAEWRTAQKVGDTQVYALANRCVRLIDTDRNLVRVDDGSVAPPLGSDDPRETGVLTSEGALWLGLRSGDPSVTVWHRDDQEWTTSSLSALNDDWDCSFPEIAAVVRDQPDSWRGSDPEALAEADRRNREGVPAPSYARRASWGSWSDE